MFTNTEHVILNEHSFFFFSDHKKVYLCVCVFVYVLYESIAHLASVSSDSAYGIMGVLRNDLQSSTEVMRT